MTIEVRPVRPEEFEVAGSVTALAYREFAREGDEDWTRYLGVLVDVAERHGRTTVLVAVEDAAVLGTVTLELDGRVEPEDEGRPLDPDEAHIRMLGVHPDARRRGIARLLMDEAMRRARAAGKTRMTLHTTTRMRAAQAMYERLGFHRRRDRVYPDGFVLLGYEREL